MNECPRCKEDKPLLYRVHSEFLNELACAECAREAALLAHIGGIWVEKIDEKIDRKNLG